MTHYTFSIKKPDRSLLRSIWGAFLSIVFLMTLLVLDGYAVQNQDVLSQNHLRNRIPPAQFIKVHQPDGEDYIVSMNVKDMKLTAALRELTEQINVGLSYDADADLDHTISHKAQNTAFYDVLDRMLNDTGLEYLVSPNRNVLVIRPLKDSNDKSLQYTVNGLVTDAETGEPLPGVNILIEGTSTGISTDAEGNFELSVESLQDTLIISYIGYKQLEVPIDGQNELMIELVQGVISGDELVVVGYGTQLKENVTSSVKVINGEDVQNVQVATFTEALAGKLSGVQISQITGEPGAATSIRVRGVGSITAGNEPLYVIDGFPLGREALSTLDMRNIESISILKDASATSIYGSRGANGVILVTTKRGGSESFEVSFSGYTGFQQVTKKLDLLSPEEYVEFAVDARNNAWEYLGGDPNDPNEDRPPFYQISPYLFDQESWTITDWQDEIFQTAPVSDYNLSVAGGTESVRYLISGGFYDQDGTIRNSYFKRYSLRSNIDAEPLERLRISGALNASIVDNRRARDEGQFNQGIVGSAINSPGFYGTQNEDGSYPSFWGFGYGVSSVRNPMAFINEYNDQRDQYRTIANLTGELDLTQGLYLKSMIGFDYNLIRDNSFENSFVYDFPENPGHVRGETSASGSQSTISDFNWLWENTVHYNFDLGAAHQFETLAGFTAQKTAIENSQISATGFPNNLVPTLNAGQISGASTTKSEWSLLSYLSRVNYAVDNRYFLSATLRTDGSSRFGTDRKWGVFPSASVGWMVSNESFFNVAGINFMKLRASYGFSGNNEIPNYGSVGLLSYNDYVVGGNIVSGLSTSTLSNPTLSWEKSEQMDLGLDLGLVNDRVNLVVDVYQSINNDLLLDVAVPSILGVTNTLQNIGKVRNRGLEVSLETRNITGRFNWSTEVNFSMNRNVVLELGPEGDPIISRSNQVSHITEIGKPIGSFYGYIFEGVYNTQEEIDNHPSLPTDVPGSPIVRDVNGDGEISSADRTNIGNHQADFHYGIVNTFAYRNIDLSVQIQGVQGVDIMNLGMRQSMSMSGRTNNLGLARERWRSPEEPGNGEVFRASSDIRGVQRDPSTFYMGDGSYLRVRNITIGYNFSPSIIGKAGLAQARIYFSTQNPFTITKYDGYNPEVSSYHNALTPGVDYFNYPLAKTYSLGVNLTF